MELPEPEYGGAETVLNLQPNCSISFAFHPLFGPHDDLMLLELDERLLPDVFQQRVTMRGQPDEDAVLCTQSKTYTIKFVGNSNSVFLVPPTESDHSALCEKSPNCDDRNYNRRVVASVLKVAPGNMELVEVAPRLDKLKMILSENPYRSEDAPNLDELNGEETNKDGLYTWEDLTARIQASDDELRSGLQALSAVEIDGYWRIVDDRCMDSILTMFLQNSVLNDWSFDALNENDVVGVMESDGFPRKLALHCLEVFGSKVGGNVDRACIWKLDEKRLCVHFARGILRGGKRKMENFMEEWGQKIPEGMQASFDMLEGEVLTERLGVETWVRAFSVSSLSSNPAERFSALFREQKKWEWKDLQPYIRDLSVPGLSSESLLLKYTRRTQPTLQSEPVFSARIIRQCDNPLSGLPEVIRSSLHKFAPSSSNVRGLLDDRWNHGIVCMFTAWKH